MPDHPPKVVHENDLSGESDADVTIDALPPLRILPQDTGGAVHHDPGNGRP